MGKELFRWRPVPLHQRCGRCRKDAAVLFEDVPLCGECFLDASKERFGVHEPPGEIEDDHKKRATAG